MFACGDKDGGFESDFKAAGSVIEIKSAEPQDPGQAEKLAHQIQ